jgi:hypothetical protein
MTQIYDADDPRAYDRNGILRDGVTIRVGMMARDSARSEHDASHIGHSGNHARPGHAIVDSAISDAAALARAEAFYDTTQAWKRTPEALRRAAADGGNATRIDPRDGVDPAEPLDVAQSQAIRDAAYREYCARLQDEWRTRP